MRRKAVGWIKRQPGAAVDVPTDDENVVLGIDRGGAKRAEVRLCVDQKRGALGMRDAPAVLLGTKYMIRRNRSLGQW